MGAENTIITGNAAAPIIGTAPVSPRFASQTYVYGRVVEVFPDRSIKYELIQDNIGLTSVTNTKGKTGVANPKNPYSIRLPLINEIVPLVKAPKNTVSTLPNQYDQVFYYLDPVNVQNTVDDNQAPRLPIPAKPGKVDMSNKNIINNQIGI